jgi:glycosyltransferase involved in cell wall biosynthesis/SAM-dependent methyltransferase
VRVPEGSDERGPDDARVAVVISCFNLGAHVAEAVASVRESEPVEVVVVDDASDDPLTVEALDRLEADGTRVIRHARNQGVSPTRMSGVAATSAPYVLALDADDMLIPGRLGEMADRLDEDPDVAVCYADYIEFGKHVLLRSVPSTLDPYRVALVNEYPPVALFRRAVLERVGGWQPVWTGLDARSDWSLWMSLAESGQRAIHLGPRRPAHLYRIHAPGLAMAGRRYHRAIYEALRATHPSLFAELDAHRRASDMSEIRKRLYPAVYGRRPMRPWVVEPYVKRLLDGLNVWTLKHPLDEGEQAELESLVQSIVDTNAGGEEAGGSICPHGIAPLEVEAQDVNRRYFVDYVTKICPPEGKVLDFGCGSGTVVHMLRQAGIDAYGVDVRWEGADFPDLTQLPLAESGHLRYYEAGEPLPFEDGEFSLIISNQVIEHVEDLDAAVAAMTRVLAPGGRLYHHYPSRMTLREPHLGIPLAHRLSPGRFRLAYVALLRRLGLGIGKDGARPRDWAASRLEYMDRWTAYRWPHEVENAFASLGPAVHHEIEYCRFRAADRPVLSRLVSIGLLRPAIEFVFRLLAFDAIEITTQAVGRAKPEAPVTAGAAADG